MLYHSEDRSAGFGGITRLGFSRTSRICQAGHRDLSEADTHRDISECGMDGDLQSTPGFGEMRGCGRTSESMARYWP